MAAPYTPDTIAAIRVQARRNLSATVIAGMLGWDLPQLLRVAKKHDITLNILRPAVPTAPINDGERKIVGALDRHAITWEDNVVTFRGKTAKLTGGDLRVLAILVSSSVPLAASVIAARSGYRPTRIAVHVSKMRHKLKPLGLSITSGLGNGYQLVLVEQ